MAVLWEECGAGVPRIRGSADSDDDEGRVPAPQLGFGVARVEVDRATIAARAIVF